MTNKSINKNIFKPLILSSGLLLGSTASLAENSNAVYFDAELAEKNREKNQTRSVLGGALIGGLIAGPPGAFLTAAFGGIISNNISNKKQKELLQSSYENSQLELFALQEQHQTLEHQHQLALEQKQNLEFDINSSLASILADSEVALHFESNSSEIEEHYQTQLQEIVRLSKAIPDAVIEISGYADRRGDNNDNLLLSQQRIKSVENSLQSLGVRNTIQSSAFGESQPLKSDQSFEGNFFDRRVIVKVRSANTDFITQNK